MVGLQKALASLGWYRWQPPGEPSGQITPTLDTALRAFQQASGLAVDGRVDPGGPTLRRLAQASGLPLNTPNDQPPDTPGSEPDTRPAPDDAPKTPDDQPPDTPADPKSDCQRLFSRHRFLQGKIETAKLKRDRIPAQLSDIQAAIDTSEQKLYELWRTQAEQALSEVAVEAAISLGLWLVRRHPLGFLATSVYRELRTLHGRLKDRPDASQEEKGGDPPSTFDPRIESESAKLADLQKQRSDLLQKLIFSIWRLKILERCPT